MFSRQAASFFDPLRTTHLGNNSTNASIPVVGPNVNSTNNNTNDNSNVSDSVPKKRSRKCGNPVCPRNSTTKDTSLWSNKCLVATCGKKYQFCDDNACRLMYEQHMNICHSSV